MGVNGVSPRERWNFGGLRRHIRSSFFCFLLGLHQAVHSCFVLGLHQAVHRASSWLCTQGWLLALLEILYDAGDVGNVHCVQDKSPTHYCIAPRRLLSRAVKKL